MVYNRNSRWYAWLTADEQRQAEQLEEQLAELRKQEMLARAERDVLRRRGDQRRYVAEAR